MGAGPWPTGHALTEGIKKLKIAEDQCNTVFKNIFPPTDFESIHSVLGDHRAVFQLMMTLVQGNVSSLSNTEAAENQII